MSEQTTITCTRSRTMRIPKANKPTIGREEPFFCAVHPKREAVMTKRNGKYACQTCRLGTESWEGRWWDNHYKKQGV